MVAAAAAAGVPIYTSSPGDSSIGMNVAYHELMNGSRLMVDPNKDVNEVCAFILAGKKNGCVILGGGSPKNFYLQGQPTLWEVYGIPKGGNDYFIQITTDSVVWGGLSGATPAEAVSWGKVNPGVLPDTVVAYADSTIAFPLFCEYAVGAHAQPPSAQGAGAQARRAGGRARQAGTAGSSARSSRHEPISSHRRWARWPPSSALTSTARPPQPRVYVDANMPARVVHAMRSRLKWDVLFVIEHDDLRRAPTASTSAWPASCAARWSRWIATTWTIAGSRPPKAAACWCCRRRARTACCGFCARRSRAAARRRLRRSPAALPLEGRKLHLHVGLARHWARTA